jgi:hypothetical protein
MSDGAICPGHDDTFANTCCFTTRDGASRSKGTRTMNGRATESGDSGGPDETDPPGTRRAQNPPPRGGGRATDNFAMRRLSRSRGNSRG